MVSTLCFSVSSSSLQHDYYNITDLFHSRDTNALALSVAPLQSVGDTMTELRKFTSLLTPLSFSPYDIVFLGGAVSLEELGSTSGDGFSGCLDRVMVNNAKLSLLLPSEMNSDLATCTPR